MQCHPGKFIGFHIYYRIWNPKNLPGKVGGHVFWSRNSVLISDSKKHGRPFRDRTLYWYALLQYQKCKGHDHWPAHAAHQPNECCINKFSNFIFTQLHYIIQNTHTCISQSTMYYFIYFILFSGREVRGRGDIKAASSPPSQPDRNANAYFFTLPLWFNRYMGNNKQHIYRMHAVHFRITFYPVYIVSLKISEQCIP